MADVTVRILFIDDSAADCELAELALRRAGLRVETRRVESAGELAHALELEWDVALIDWVMPELTTPEAVRILDAAAPWLPYLVWTGQADPKVAELATRTLGAAGFLDKGQLAVLPAMLAEILR